MFCGFLMKDGEYKSKLEKHGGADVYVIGIRKVIEEVDVSEIVKGVSGLIKNGNTTPTVVDFANVEHLSSAALGGLDMMRNEAFRNGRLFALVDIGPQINDLFEITRLYKSFRIYGSVDDAIMDVHRIGVSQFDRPRDYRPGIGPVAG
jgi:anti-sigma B factor antagonist